MGGGWVAHLCDPLPGMRGEDMSTHEALTEPYSQACGTLRRTAKKILVGASLFLVAAWFGSAFGHVAFRGTQIVNGLLMFRWVRPPSPPEGFSASIFYHGFNWSWKPKHTVVYSVPTGSRRMLVVVQGANS